MKKSLIIALIVIVLVIVGVFIYKRENSSNTETIALETYEDYENVINKVHELGQNGLFGILTRELELEYEVDDAIVAYTGLENREIFEKVVVSESMITSKAYSLTMAKVKEGENVQEVAKAMVENMDMRRWICVGAEVIYATTYNDVVFLVMGDKDVVKPEFDAFKEIVNQKVTKDIVREDESIEF